MSKKILKYFFDKFKKKGQQVSYNNSFAQLIGQIGLNISDITLYPSMQPLINKIIAELKLTAGGEESRLAQINTIKPADTNSAPLGWSRKTNEANFLTEINGFKNIALSKILKERLFMLNSLFKNVLGFLPINIIGFNPTFWFMLSYLTEKHNLNLASLFSNCVDECNFVGGGGGGEKENASKNFRADELVTLIKKNSRL